MSHLIQSWDQYFILIAYTVAMKSKDTSTSAGCVVVGPDYEIRTTGYNNFIRGWNDDDPRNYERPFKYDITEHFERNAIYNAVRSGVSLNGCTMYSCWYPCVPCARAICQSGIKEIVYHYENPMNNIDRWEDGKDVALELFERSNVVLRAWSGKIPALTTRINGELVDPTKF